MPLSPPQPRERLHTRKIECHGYLRSDGLYEIEGRIIDTKAYDFPNRFRGEIKSGEPVHEMALRLTLDSEMRIEAAEASIDAGPYHPCAEIAPAYAALKGEQIGPGWARKIKALFGRTRGCVHLLDLLGPVATVAFQTIVPLRQRLEREETTPLPKDAPRDTPVRPFQIDKCHAWASDGEIVREEWPDFYTGGKNTPDPE